MFSTGMANWSADLPFMTITSDLLQELCLSSKLAIWGHPASFCLSSIRYMFMCLMFLFSFSLPYRTKRECMIGYNNAHAIWFTSKMNSHLIYGPPEHLQSRSSEFTKYAHWRSICYFLPKIGAVSVQLVLQNKLLPRCLCYDTFNYSGKHSFIIIKLFQSL